MLEGAQNYHIWSIRFKNALVMKGWESAINAALPVEQRAEHSAKALAAMSNCVEQHHVAYIAGAATALEAWQTLQGIFRASTSAHKSQLKAQLNSLRMESGEGMDVFVGRAKALQVQLAGVGAAVDEADLVDAVIKGLPSSYQVVSDVMLYGNRGEEDALTVDELLANLLAHEARLKGRPGGGTREKALYGGPSGGAGGGKSGGNRYQQGAGGNGGRHGAGGYKAGNGGDRSGGFGGANRQGGHGGKPGRDQEKKCYYCNKPGHLKRDCRKKQADEASGKGFGGGERVMALTAVAKVVLKRSVGSVTQWRGQCRP
jgi:hypothetical protein